MSLRFQLNLIIMLICLFALLLGSAITVINARDSVFEEVSSSLILASKLIKQGARGDYLSGLDKVRHLRIAVIDDNKEEIKGSPTVIDEKSIPSLFVQFVRPNLKQLTLLIDLEKGGQTVRLVADPSDEIKEAWKEALVFLGVLLSLTLLISCSVFIVIGRALRPVDDILLMLGEIEQGNYLKRLEAFNLPEFAQIATGLNHLNEKLAWSKSEHQRLNKKALDISENERHYLARELHDEMGQSLTAIKALAVSAKYKKTVSKEALCQIESICDHLFGVVRNRMQQLTPALLAEFGLLAAVTDLVDKWPGESEIVLNIDNSTDQLVGAEAIYYYRIIQESLTNVLKYAKATQVQIELIEIKEGGQISIRLSIKDNGVGFDPAVVDWGGGLTGIKERVESLGGSLLIQAVKGGGVQLSTTLSIGKANE
ncbi:MAG: hypothetical protein A6F70_04600 [Cycloclasticus sp. symbiont of Bathymodiolus heckerae]|nr:MAG: hypothetical protein A6F70_04600 [Cycloclasticus sp. symbiont of Bathymodiolus heckerae]